jgi:phage baseplate assembly protein W
MTTDFLGVGWGFPVRQGSSGEVVLARHEDSVRESIWLILNTSPGERVMRPTFGCGLDDSVFSVAGATTSGLVAAAVRNALAMWEPRLELLEVEVTPDEGRASTLNIRISYVVRATNNVFNLVYPFYLDQVEG